MQRIYGTGGGFILVAILIALAVRTIVISSSPTFLLGGDTPGYVAYTREIIQNGFLVPGLNTLHFPGSFWVYPPILPYFWSIVSNALGNNPLTPFYVIEISGIVADSFVIIPLYKTARTIFGNGVAKAAALMFTVYLPDLYALTWGGVPQLFATLIFAWVIYFTVMISKQETRSRKNAVALGITLVILTFTHDLTIFVTVFVLTFVLVASILLKKVKVPGLRPNGAHLNSIVKNIPLSLLIGLPAILLWYIPRYWWIIDAGAPYIDANLPAIFPQNVGTLQLIFQGVNGYLSPLGFAIFLIPLVAWSLYVAVRRDFEKSGVILLFALSPILISIVDFHDPTIVARMGYYTFLPSLILASYGIIRLKEMYTRESKAERGSYSIKPSGNQKRVIAVMLPLILVSALGVSANMNSHTFYNSYVDSSPSQVIDYSTLNWIHSNVPKNSTFASFGEFGYYIMGYDGNPTLVYQNLKYLTQPTEWNESVAAYALVYQPSQNLTLTEHLITKYNVSYVTSIVNVSVPGFYKEIYTDNSTTIYYVK